MKENKTILTLDSLHKNKNIEEELKKNNHNKLWGELIFICQNLKKNYMKKII